MDILGVLEITQPYVSCYSENAIAQRTTVSARAAPGEEHAASMPLAGEPPFSLRKRLGPLLSLAPDPVNFPIQLGHH